MPPRARGSNAQSALAFENNYGVAPTSGYFAMPFVSANLGEQQGLIDPDLLGQGRQPQAVGDDVIDNMGDVTVPIDLRAFGFWLKLLLGQPVSTQGTFATGTIAFTVQPLANATITLGGQAFTFVAANPTGNQILIGADLATTLANAVLALNSSAVTAVQAAYYETVATGNQILITHKTLGTGGNSFALAASVATVSGSTLAGGSTTGPYNHVFTPSFTVPLSAAFEIGLPDVGSYGLNYGICADTLEIDVQRSGNSSAKIGLMAQGERRSATSLTGTKAAIALERFPASVGSVSYNGTVLGDIVSGKINYSNGLEAAENLRADSRIDGIDAGMVSAKISLVARFSSTTLLDLATNRTGIEITFNWKISATKSLKMVVHNVRLPRPRIAVQGPQGIQVTFDGIGQVLASTNRTITVTLVNDVASY